jgi:nicotinamide-nucleotide amidase
MEAKSREELKKRDFKPREILGDYIYGKNEDTLEAIVGRLLLKRNLTISAAESCTGGLIMHRLTNVPGSSRYFLGGVVSYSNELKIRVLGVRDKTLKTVGAVSREVAREMASGVRKLMGSDIGVSTTGIAGPSGGSEEKPVGLVYTAISTKEKTIIEKNIFKGDRWMIKERASQKALDMVRLYLMR